MHIEYLSTDGLEDDLSSKSFCESTYLLLKYF